MMKTIQEGWKRPFTPLMLLLLGFGLRLMALDSQSLWWDELKTWDRATMPLNEMVTGLIGIRDQVPLYYGLMRLWAWMGTEAFVLRLFSVFLGLLGIALIYKIGQKSGGQAVGLLAAFLLAISPFHIWYSQEVRMYALLLTLLLAAHLLLLRLLDENKTRWWLLYGLVMTAAIYTHYFAFFVVLIHYVFFVLHMRQLKRQTASWFLTMTAVGAAFAPWVWLVLTRTDGYRTAVPDWITRIQWTDPLLTLEVFTVGFGLGSTSWWAILATGLFLLGLLLSLRLLRSGGNQLRKRPLSRPTLHTRLLFLWASLPLVITFLVSLDFASTQTGGFSIYNDRYLIISLPPFLLLVTLGWQTLRPNRVLTGLALLFITLISGFSLAQQTTNPAFARNDWRGAIAYMETASTSEPLIIGHKDLLLPINYYGNGRIQFVQIPPPETATEITPAFATSMAKQLASAAEKNTLAWHAELFYNQNPHGFPDERNTLVASEDQNPTQLWLNTHFTQLEIVRLPGIRFTLYDISGETP